MHNFGIAVCPNKRAEICSQSVPKLSLPFLRGFFPSVPCISFLHFTPVSGPSSPLPYCLTLKKTVHCARVFPFFLGRVYLIFKDCKEQREYKLHYLSLIHPIHYILISNLLASMPSLHVIPTDMSDFSNPVI